MIIERRHIQPLLALILVAAGCATSSATKPGAKAAPAKSAQRGPGSKAPQSSDPQMPRMGARAERLFGDAVAAYEEQKKKGAINWESLEPKWRSVIDAEDVPEAYYNLGVVLERLRRLPEARSAYAKAVELKPSLRQAALNAAVLAESDDPRAAVANYTEFLRRYPEDAGARVRLATIYQESGQLDEAWRLAREALMNDPRSIGAYKVMMRVSIERGNLDLAELIALQAQKIDNADPDIAFIVGQVRAKQDDENGAISQYRKAISLRDDYLPARYELLRFALKKQAWDAVADQARSILRLEAKDPRIHLVLGIAYRYLNEPDKAMAEYAEAEKAAAGKLPEVHIARGVLYMKVKNVCEPAMNEFKKFMNDVPHIAANSPVVQLQRECEQIMENNRKAEDEIRRLKEEDAKKEQEKKDKEAAKAAQPPAGGKAAPAKAPADGPKKAAPAPAKPGNGKAEKAPVKPTEPESPAGGPTGDIEPSDPK